MVSMIVAVAASRVSTEVAASSSRMTLKGCQKAPHSTLQAESAGSAGRQRRQAGIQFEEGAPGIQPHWLGAGCRQGGCLRQAGTAVAAAARSPVPRGAVGGGE